MHRKAQGRARAWLAPALWIVRCASRATSSIAAVLGACAAILCTTACIVDSDKPCDRGRVELKGALTGCVCAPGSVPTPDNSECVPCGKNEEARNGVCECATGYQRAAEGCLLAPDSGQAAEDEDAGMSTAPTGEDTPCAAQADCAAFEADFCLPFPNSRFCAVRNCISKQNTCSGDRVCCDVSGANGIFSDLTMASGICVTTAACAMGGTVVTP